MTRKDALADLIAKVEAGTLDVNNRHWLSVLPPHTWDCAWRAYCFNSLDAASALHEAVLPGYGWMVGCGAALVYKLNELPRSEQISVKTNPARAWLLAILHVLHAQEPE